MRGVLYPARSRFLPPMASFCAIIQAEKIHHDCYLFTIDALQHYAINH